MKLRLSLTVPLLTALLTLTLAGCGSGSTSSTSTTTATSGSGLVLSNASDSKFNGTVNFSAAKVTTNIEVGFNLCIIGFDGATVGSGTDKISVTYVFKRADNSTNSFAIAGVVQGYEMALADAAKVKLDTTAKTVTVTGLQLTGYSAPTLKFTADGTISLSAIDLSACK
jgi:hypothetical protein